MTNQSGETWPSGTIVETVEKFDEMERFIVGQTIRAVAVPTTPEQFDDELDAECRVMELHRRERFRRWFR